MKNRIGRTRISHEDLQLYFDGELTGAEAQELAAQIEAEPGLRSELEQMGLIRDLVSAGLEREADAIPAARFEQIWDDIDRAIDNDARQRESTGQEVSIWTRLWAALKPFRLPAVAAAGAAALAVVVLANIDEDANKAEQVASVEQPEASQTEPKAENPNMPSSDAIAAAPMPAPEPEMTFPEPKPAEADIHAIEFGGKNGRIAKTGTVTVLYVEEDIDDENDSERSL